MPSGLYGPRGGGISRARGPGRRGSRVIQGTLAKSYRRDRRLYHRLGRALRLSSAASRRASSSPARCRQPVAAGAIAAIRHLKESSAERERQQDRVAALASQRLDAAGIPHLANPSHIVPVMVGDPEGCAKRSATRLLARFDIYVQPINYPTVPRRHRAAADYPLAAAFRRRYRPSGGRAERDLGQVGLQRAA